MRKEFLMEAVINKIWKLWKIWKILKSIYGLKKWSSIEAIDFFQVWNLTLLTCFPSATRNYLQKLRHTSVQVGGNQL